MSWQVPDDRRLPPCQKSWRPLPALAALGLLLLAGCSRNEPQRVSAPTAAATQPAPSRAVAAPSPLVGPETPGAAPQAGGIPLALTGLHMSSALEGWATGWTADHQRGGVLRTADGGLHWYDVSPPGFDLLQIETTGFLDANHAWLVAGGERGVDVLRTQDGGQTWQAGQPLRITSAGPGWLDFTDPQRGWLMANLGASAGSMAVAIYRTVDGGAHWEAVSTTAGSPARSSPGSLPLACNKTGISFVNASTGWATGHCTTGGIFFYVTHDAGRTWVAQPLRPPADSPAGLFGDCDCETTPPVFASARNGVAPVKIFTSQHEAVLYATQDGGTTWQPSELSTNRLLRPPDFVSARDGWVTDEDRVFATHDGGRTWTPAASLPSLRLLGVFDFVDLRNGWVTGGEEVYRTADGGKSWQRVTPSLVAGPAAAGAPGR